jgi:hypothetical protein
MKFYGQEHGWLFIVVDPDAVGSKTFGRIRKKIISDPYPAISDPK